MAKSHPSILEKLRSAEYGSSEASLARARRLVSARTGVINSLVVESLYADEPSVFWARSLPGRTEHVLHQAALAQGDGASTSRDRALMKALGETIERYCSAFVDYENLTRSTKNHLKCESVDLKRFVLFSAEQYRTAGFPFERPTDDTTLNWVAAFSLIDGRAIAVPASLVFVPYDSRKAREIHIDYPISTGLACGANWTMALYKGILEVVERDHFMLAWHHGLTLPRIDLGAITDPFIGSLIAAFPPRAFTLTVLNLTLDLGIPTVLSIVRSKQNAFPLAVVGLGADLDPKRALTLSLEEAALGVIGMGRLAIENSTLPQPFRPSFDYGNVSNLHQHGLAFAIDRSLAAVLTSLEGKRTQCLTDLPSLSRGTPFADLSLLANMLQQNGFEPLGVDLTLQDIADVGFRVTRAIVPGLIPLDIAHSLPHRGGSYNRIVQDENGPRNCLAGHCNPYPHPFP